MKTFLCKGILSVGAVVLLSTGTLLASDSGSIPESLARYLSCDRPILGPYIVDGKSMVFYDKVCNKEPVPTVDYLVERDRKRHEEQVAQYNYLKERAGL